METKLQSRRVLLKRVSVFFASTASMLGSSSAYAYMGLGPLIPIIGFSLVFLFVIGATIVGFLAYPFKKLYDLFRRTKQVSSDSDRGVSSPDMFEAETDQNESPFCSQKKHGLITILSTLEAHLTRDRVVEKIEKPIFVCGLARSGTTVITEIINLHPDTGSFLYKDLPFVRIPYFWSFMNDWYYRGVGEKRRLHGDRLKVSPNSPDAFEELIWMDHLEKYVERAHVSEVSTRFRSKQLEDDLRQIIKKILFVRGKKSRYLAKGNYNVLRLAYIARMFPDAKFIICFRDPIQQCRSLERVHLRFKELASDLKSFEKKVRAIGHFEFGNSRKPIKINSSEFDETLHYWNLQDNYSGYLAQWISVYSKVLDIYLNKGQKRENILLLRHDQLIEHAMDSLQTVFNFCELAITDQLMKSSAEKIELGQRYTESITYSSLETRAADLYKQLSSFP